MQLDGAHKILASFTKNPALELSQKESESLAGALVNLSKQYNVTVSPTLMAWLQLGGVSAAIYGPRIAVILAVNKMKAQQAQQANRISNAGNTATNSMTAAPRPLEPSSGAQPGKMTFQ